ncbi:MotA/TolQ/ExbB proton channel family protein [Sporomusa acidovorans]|uniref:Tol-Pal system protein TolQ n=1 Tax=Sporomusa acidovorans (strain ATCC 49682 / DSM 3132 / Mol) TaxID=1123286 RepID=A0ABZ3IXQ2_SPOA4|nr:MotA/TolQ/ExbB proton channel family protein [Sporomusa acidovorans]OZC22209.1 biopolymer transport protein ExbB [Sporomusa acidovorans DSM 3132]SDE81543.1 biopolymer transport protein ExbB [Sporomusa acidovorans]
MEVIGSSLELFKKGGLVMYPLLLCSLLVVTIAVERYMVYRRAATDDKKLLHELMVSLDRYDWEGAKKACAGAGGVTGMMVARGLENIRFDACDLESAMTAAAAQSAAKLRNKLGYLDTIVTLSPLLGLLGTVIGMISSFSIMNIKAGQPQAITGGVGEALVATATGLCVAVMALIVHTYFSHWLDTIITGMEECSAVLIEAKRRSDRRETA